MSAVNEWIVREYFEEQGYLVSQPCKYAARGGRQKRAEEDVDLVVYNPQVKAHVIPDHMVWTTEDVKNISRAVVGVRGWHTDRFYVSTIENTPEILSFVEPEALKFAQKFLGSDSMARILCLPRLPENGELKDKTIRVLKEKGIDGVISFHTILTELVACVGVNRNYVKSDLLQVIRLMKNYDLIKDSQMDMFAGARRRQRARGARGDATAPAGD